MQHPQLAQQAISSLDIDMDVFRRHGKSKALQYLIERMEKKQFGVSRVVYDHRLLPRVEQSRRAYKRSSGFIIYNEKIPFLSLPATGGSDEAPGRQIYTLLLLVVMALTGYYNIVLTPSKEERLDQIESYSTKEERLFYKTVNEILVPKNITDELVGANISERDVRRLANKYNSTPAAMKVILAQRGFDGADDIELRKPPKTSGGRSIPATQAIEKFCGRYMSNQLKLALLNKSLNSSDFENLVCGIRNKRFTTKLLEEGWI